MVLAVEMPPNGSMSRKTQLTRFFESGGVPFLASEYFWFVRQYDMLGLYVNLDGSSAGHQICSDTSFHLSHTAFHGS